MISLIFKILGDATGFNRTVKTDVPNAAKEGGKKAGKVAGSEFGKEFGQQMKSGIMSFIGAGAIIGAVRKQITEATKLTADAAKEGIGVEGFQELTRAAEAMGITVKDLRAVFPEAAEEISKLLESVRSSGGIIDKDTVNQLADAGADLRDFTNQFSPVVSMLLRAAQLLIEIPVRLGRIIGAAIVMLGGAAVGSKNSMRGGYDEIVSALTTPLLPDPQRRNRIRADAEAANAGVEASRAREAEAKAVWLSQIADLSNAGPQRDMAMMRMVPGMSEEMLDALNEMSSKLTSIDGSLKTKL